MQDLKTYKQTEINAADSVKVVSMLYDGAVNFLKVARGKLQHGDIAGKGLYVGKTTAIVTELSVALNMETGGEVAKNLDRLYDYVIDRLMQGHLKNDLTAFDDAERVLDTLRSGWKEMEQKRNAVNGAASASSRPSLSSGVGLKV